MVIPLLELPEALQPNFASCPTPPTTAGRLAQASQFCKELLQARLAELKEQHRLAAEQVAQARRDRKFDLILSCFEPLEEGAIVFRCITHSLACGTTPCRCSLKVPHDRLKLSLMLNHIKTRHPTEYSIVSLMFGVE